MLLKRIFIVSILITILLTTIFTSQVNAYSIVIADGLTNHVGIKAGLGWGNAGDNIYGLYDKFVVGATGYTVTSVTIYVAYITTAPTNGQMFAGIWDDSTGPHDLLYSTDPIDCAGNIVTEWNIGADSLQINFTDPVELTAGTYYFGVNMSTLNTNTRFVSCGSTDGGAALTITTGYVLQGTNMVNWGISAQNLNGYETGNEPQPITETETETAIETNIITSVQTSTFTSVTTNNIDTFVTTTSFTETSVITVELTSSFNITPIETTTTTTDTTTTYTTTSITTLTETV